MTAAPPRRLAGVFRMHAGRNGGNPSAGPDWSIAFGTVQVVSSATSLLASGVIGPVLAREGRTVEVSVGDEFFDGLPP
jgi:hypothetical protein